MSKHTPGPWQAHAEIYDRRVVVRAAGMTPVAEIWMVGQPETQRHADARLIAAAPELLEALSALAPMAQECAEELCASGMSPLYGAISAARAAIAKATGEQA